MRERNSRNFQVDVDCAIDPCEKCIVKDEKSLEHCKPCRHNPFKKTNDDNLNVNTNIIEIVS